MFDNFRDKFYSVVQDGINLNNTVRRKITQAQQSTSKNTLNFQFIPPGSIDYSAGAELLEKYQNEWTELHENAEKNAKDAENIDIIMSDIHNNVKKRLEDVTNINTCLVGLPKVISSVGDCVNRLQVLSDLFETVEKELIRLEAIVERSDFEQRKMEHKFQLHMYKEKKLVALETSRVRLSEQQAQESRRSETRQRRLLEDRQAEAAMAFQQDLALYRNQGELPSKLALPKAREEPKLEEIQLDTDDTAELDDFLST